MTEIQTWKTLEKTYAMIKPNAVAAGSEQSILQMAEDAGFTIIAKEYMQLTPERAGAFYGEHMGKPFYEKLVGFMSSGPIMALALAKTNAIQEWRDLMGPTNSEKPREEAPNSIRAKFGIDNTQNATHGSDSPTSAARELKFFFPKLILDPVPEGAAAREFIQSNLSPTLVKGLAALCKEKPTAGKMEAISWLADWLSANNPNKPMSFTEAQLVLDPEDEEEEDFAVIETANAEEDPDAGIDDLEEQAKAATAVQSHFRGHQARKNMKQKQGGGVVVVESHTKTEEEAAEGDDEAKAAATVQANFRGHLARKQTKKMKAEESAAATKMQSGFRGHQDRKKVRDMKAAKAAPAEAAPAEAA